MFIRVVDRCCMIDICSLRCPFNVWQAARHDDMDDIISLESAGLSLDSKDLHGRTGYYFLSELHLVDIFFLAYLSFYYSLRN